MFGYNLVLGVDIDTVLICSTSDRPTGPLYSPGNVLLLIWRTDDTETRRGFLAYVSIEPGVYLMAGRFSLFIYWWPLRITWWLLSLLFPKNLGGGRDLPTIFFCSKMDAA